MPLDLDSVPSLLDPAAVIADFHAGPKDGADPLANGAGPVFAIGRNAEAEALAASVPLAGLVDDFAKDAEWRGVPVVRSEEVPPGAVVVNCSTSISPLSVERRLRSLPGVRALAYADLYRQGGSPVPLPAFVADARAEFAERAEEFAWVFGRLKDPESRRVFNRLMAYRLTGSARFMEGFSVRLRDQYFEDFVPNPGGLTFADCGGFDGDTTEEFIARYPDYRKVILFEPSPANLAKARRRLAEARDIEFVPLGVSDTPGTLSFDPDAASASAVSEAGSFRIEVTTLDAHVAEPLSFIKMDLEGWELTALKGAARHIVEDRPVLAIAVYHHIADFWKIPRYILSLQPGYDVHLRHYTEGWSETVMYFVPRAA